MAAFDGLPAAVREKIAYLTTRVSASDVRDALRGAGVATVLAMLDKTQFVALEVASRRWRETYGRELPHVAARATLMVTCPRGAHELRRRQLGQAIAALPRRT